MTWFKTLTGFAEESPEQVREHFVHDGGHLTSKVNGRRLQYGELETPTLAELRKRVGSAHHGAGKTSFREVVADVQALHVDEANARATFQVASQFNLLEMTSPNVTPERGIAIYEHDRTQGPACAIAAGAGTIYRNYFVPVNGQRGQSADNQIDCLLELGAALGNSGNRLWTMTNGYALPTREGLIEIANRLRNCSEGERDQLRQLLRIGIQWDTQVTLKQNPHTVSQAYCSALPVAYQRHPRDLWAEFATLILEAAYEATFCTAILNSRRGCSNQLYLTLLGGGAFGNDREWILAALSRALRLHAESGLAVAIVSHGQSNQRVRAFVDGLS